MQVSALHILTIDIEDKHKVEQQCSSAVVIVFNVNPLLAKLNYLAFALFAAHAVQT